MLLSTIFRRRAHNRQHLFRSSIFGLEDSLVSSVGFLAGYAAIGSTSNAIIKGGLILIMVEAFSMGVGTFLSENNSEEIMRKGKVSLIPALQSSFVMFISYLIGGFFVLLPYLFFSPHLGGIISVLCSLFGLSGIGVITAYFAKTSYVIELVKAILIGGLATLIGVGVGLLV